MKPCRTVLTIVGARPQFIKAAVVSRALRARQQADAEFSLREILVHTGQHYDANLSQVFFDELSIPRPDHHLEIGSSSHGAQTGAMLAKLESVMQQEQPDLVLVYGDTNSTLAGALAAAKLHIPIAHVEAGLRSFNRSMPEEINRVMTDHLSEVLFCPTSGAVDNLRAEGLPQSGRGRVKVMNTGDVMYDATLFYGSQTTRSVVLSRLGVTEKKFILATIHRAENTDDPAILAGLVEALDRIGQRLLPIVWPVHPRTRAALQNQRGENPPQSMCLRLVEPLGFLDMQTLEHAAKLILTDSGGVQKEAYFHGVPCVTLRTETEWVELVEAGWNIIAGVGPQGIISAVEGILPCDWGEKPRPPFYGTGHAGEEIVEHLYQHLNRDLPCRKREEATTI